ncbi:MAG: hypothetical protein K6E83_11210 [Clostridium sp.]|nr:hypothetical protein [Clostridium sp.]
MKRLLALGLVFTLLFATPAFAAQWTYGSAGWEWQGEDAAAYTGTYRLSSMMGINLEEFAAFADSGDLEELKNLIIIDLLDDGTAVLSSDGDSLPLIWNVAGGAISLLAAAGAEGEDEVLSGTYSDGVIALNIDGMEMTLSKEGADTGSYLQEQQGTSVEPVNDGLVTGIYKLYDVMGLSVVSYAALIGATVEEAQNTMVIQLFDGGTGTITADGEAAALTWSMADGILYLTAEGETIPAICQDGMITIDLEGESVTLSKVS